MKLFENILNRILLIESVSVDDVEDAIDNHKRIIINYHSKGENKNSGARVIEVYAYGLTKAGNPVIRCFQPYGDTTTRVPSWKFFRLDRITAWKPTKQTFDHPADDDYTNIGDFNPNGDETMSVVYKVANFGDNNISQTQTNSLNSQPKTKQDIYKTDTEKNMENLRQQLKNPINISDIKDGDKFKVFTQEEPKEKSGPKTKDEIYKTDTERGMERLKQQLKNPQKIDLSQFEPNKKVKSSEQRQKDLDKLRQTLDTDKPLTLADISKKMQEPEIQKSSSDDNDLYKTDTERAMEKLKQQLQNPTKIDLSKIPKR